MFYGEENDMIVSKQGRHPACQKTEGTQLSRMICQYCGTYYDSADGKCPICGACVEAGPTPTPQPEKKKPAVKDDTIIVMGKLMSKMAQEPQTPAAETTQAPEGAVEPKNPPEQPAPEEAPKPAAQEKAPAPEEPPRFTRTPELMKEAQKAAPAPRTPARQEPPKAAAPSASPEQPPKKAAPAERKPIKKKPPVSTRDKVICIVLGVIAALLALYIAYRFLRPGWATGKAPETTASTTEGTQATVPCAGVTVDSSVTFTAQGQAQLLNVTLSPADTTDSLTFQSDNTAVATVTAEGLVTAVAPGRATVTVTCGSATALCSVDCDFTVDTSETTEPSGTTEETTEPTEEPTEALELDRTDITFFSKGETTRLKVGSLSPAEVQWSSDNSSVASVDNGWVTAEGSGTTRVRAVYQGQELVCIVRCNFDDGDETDPPATEDSDGGVTISHTDVTLSVDETFTLRLRDADGNTLNVSWSAGNSSVCTVSGNTVTAVGSGYTEVSCTYDGETYTCIVRVR